MARVYVITVNVTVTEDLRVLYVHKLLVVSVVCVLIGQWKSGTRLAYFFNGETDVSKFVENIFSHNNKGRYFMSCQYTIAIHPV